MNAPVRIFTFLVSTVIAISLTTDVFAQRRYRDSADPFSWIDDEGVQNELKLTGDQKAALEKVAAMKREKQNALTQDIRKRFEESPKDKYSELTKQTRGEYEQLALEMQDELKKAMKPEQHTRLMEIVYQKAGPRALRMPGVDKALGLTDQQKVELAKLESERGLARRKLGFRASAEDRKKFDEEWTAKTTAILNDDQKQAFTKMKGVAYVSADEKAESSTSTAATPTKTAEPAKKYEPPKSDDPAEISFDAQGDRAGNPENRSRPRPKNAISFSMQNAPWELVLNRFAKQAGYTLQILDMPTGTISHQDDAWYTPEEALDELHGYLLQEGFVMIKRGKFLVVLNHEKRPIPPNLIPNVDVQDLPQHGKHEIVNVIIPLEGLSAADAAKEAEQLKGPQGKVVPLETSNALFITDTATVARRIYNLLQAAVPKDEGSPEFKSYALKYIDANDAEGIVRNQFGLGSSTPNVSYASGYDRSRDSRYRSSSSSSRSSSSSSRSSSSDSTPAQVTADPRTNSLLITATRGQQAVAEQILKTIDTNVDSQGNPLRMGSIGPYLKVYKLEKGDAGEAAKTLNAIMPGVVVNEDRYGRTVHIMASERQHREIEDLIKQLGGQGGGEQNVAVFHLKTLDPVGAAATIQSLFTIDGDDAPVIKADTFGKRLIARGTAEQVTQMRALLSQLGEDGQPGETQSAYQSGPIRNFPLAGRDPNEFANLLEQLWKTKERTPIRVIIPSTRNPIRNRVVPSTREDLDSIREDRPTTRDSRPRDDRQTRVVPNRPGARAVPVSLISNSVNRAPQPAEPSDYDAPKSQPTSAKADATPHIFVNAVGGVTLDGKFYREAKLLVEPLKAALKDRDSKNVKLTMDPKTPASLFSGVFAAVQQAGGVAVVATEDPAPKAKTGDTAPRPEPKSTTPDAVRTQVDPQVDGISVTVRDGVLYIIGQDEETLNRMEDLVMQLADAVPPRTEWTVFYLRSADATETSTMLEQLFPQSSIGSAADIGGGSLMDSITGGVRSLGSDLMNMTGIDSMTQSAETLRIIPDIRSNSLFVSGRADYVQQVEDVLRVLDADELPETLRDRVPRTIEVKHANIYEVADIIKEVYEPYMKSTNQRQQVNPLAMMMGGGSSGGRRGGRQETEVRLTVGVDASNSNLVVAASDALYRQIQETVADLDKRAEDAQHTTTVISVSNVDAAVLQDAVGVFLPTVRVSTSGGNNNNQQGSSSSRSGDSNRSSDDARRRAFMEAMQRRQSGGSSTGTSNTPGTSSPFSRPGGSTRGGSTRGSGFPFGSTRGSSGRSRGRGR